ncbi:MAG TPA: hypothetical protein VKK79_16640 [Candidatus Lokiarchaeia archaeon]|nr:hypothetical protein [Candidatus Lokiarchaeia archaeon]
MENTGAEARLPLVTFIKNEVNKIVFGEQFDYGALIEPLLRFNTEVIAVSVVYMMDGGNVLYATDTWELTEDCIPIVKQWNDASADPIVLYGVKHAFAPNITRATDCQRPRQ